MLPVLENEVNDQTVKHLESLSRQAEEICEYLDYSVRQLWKTCVSVRKKDQEQKESPIELVIEKESFFQSFPAVRKLLLQKCIGKVRGGQKDLTSAHLQSVSELSLIHISQVTENIWTLMYPTRSAHLFSR